MGLIGLSQKHVIFLNKSDLVTVFYG